MHNLPLPPARLEALLRAHAEGVPAAEAATELLIDHGHWLHRRDFLAYCVQVDHQPTTGHIAAWVEWDNVIGFLQDVACSASEARILRLAAELAGTDTGVPLVELLTGLDRTNTSRVVVAVGRALGLPTTPSPVEQVVLAESWGWHRLGTGIVGIRPGGGTYEIFHTPDDPRYRASDQAQPHRCRDHAEFIGPGSYPYECVVCYRRLCPEDLHDDQDDQ